VGVGASAGGLEAFTQLLRALPVDTGMAFVLVQHLSPTHESVLAEILSRATTLPVTEVVEEPELEPNHVYVIPPDRNMVIEEGHLRLLPREALGKQHPIDGFFRSLAESLNHRAIGVVLSGTATDGTLGLEDIKAEGGITFAQDDSAQQRGMPQSAIASGCVDFVLSPQAIAAEIARIGAHPYVTAQQGLDDATKEEPEALGNKSDFAPILEALQRATGIAFHQYKANTLLRRIKRRMVLKKEQSVEEYVALLRSDPEEVESLYQDILINVTSFFRNPETFEVLQRKIIPALLLKRARNDPLRIWVLGCSTGEEAYSLAMILSELIAASNEHASAQVFATDLSASSLQRARAGVYSKERVQGVSRERLRRFFVPENGEYRIAKSVRDMCIFSRHDVMVDPPFSRVDLVSCRNLLIYLEPSLQQEVIPLLHYALKPGGFLVLGASEAIGRFTDLFGAADAKHKIFAKKPGPGRLPVMPIRWRRSEHPAAASAKTTQSTPARIPTAGTAVPGTIDVYKVAARLVASLAPPAVLVDADFEVLHSHGDIAPYLSLAPGKASHSLLKMAREGMLVPLQTLLKRAKRDGTVVHQEGVRIKSTERLLELDLEVVPIKGSSHDDGCFLVLFKQPLRADRSPAKTSKRRPVSKAAKRDAALEQASANIARLEDELSNTRDYLQQLSDQYEASNEELQSANEEAQSANEELQSINEELETSKEEIESSNEELTTVNDELNHRNVEVGRLINDLTNLMGSVQLAIVVVGRDLRVRRFSPTAEKLLSVVAADVGRPIHDIKMDFDLDDLDGLLEEVIDATRSKDVEVQDRQGRWWSLRISPYLTLENTIDGAVLMLVDIDALKVSEQAIASARDYLRKWEHIFNHAGWAVATTRADTDELEFVNPAFARMHGYGVEQLIGRPLSELLDSTSREELPGHLRQTDSQGSFTYEAIHVRRDGSRFPVQAQATSLKDDSGRTLYRAATFQDVTEHRRLEQDLNRRNEELAAADIAKNQFISVLSHELRSPLNVILLWSHILQGPDRTDDDLRTGLEIIEHSSRAQARLIEDLLDIHRITYGRVSLELTEVDLGTITRSVVDSLMPDGADKGIHIELNIDPAPVLVRGDSARLEQVLRNLLGNALRFTPRGGRIQVALHRESQHAVLSVSDTGQGISTEAMPHIFDRYRRPLPLQSAAHGGLGLGLSIAKHLVDLLGGTLSAHSPGLDKGSTFTVRLLLLAPGEVRQQAPKGPQAKADSKPLAGILVMVVDDDPAQRKSMDIILQRAGAEVVACSSADDAMIAVEEQLPDVIVSDILMPIKNGYDLLRAVRALSAPRGGQVPAIAVSASASAQDRARALEAGFQTHMAKPIEPAVLIAAVAAFARGG
jgi:two-component system CheB/CheR fusion protein